MRIHALVAVLALGACSDDSVSFDGYADAVKDAYCRYLHKCNEVESVDACMHANIGLSIRISASEQAIVDMGKAKYNGVKAKQCVDALANRSCDLTSQSARVQPQACRDLAGGTVHDGGACADDLECISLSCNVPTCQMACCQGTCTGDTKPGDAKLGESCMTNVCVAGTHCDAQTTTCVALKPAGMACTSSTECDYELACTGTGAARTCGALPKQDEACTLQCRDVGNTCSPTSQTCVKVGFAGAECMTSAQCGVAYRCDATKHCAPGIALNAACTAVDRCEDDTAFCDIPNGMTMGTCVLPKPDGQPCTRDSNCQSRTCDPVMLMCAPEPVCI